MDQEQAFQAALKRGLFAGLSMPRVVILPWPDKVLSPNARVHWARRAGAVKRARAAAFYATRAVISTKPNWAGVGLFITFCPPDKRRRDRDNLISSMKAVCDGIADALGVDDSKFIPAYAFGEPIKGGAVQVEISPIQP